MKLLLIGGFLGAGKTTLLKNLVELMEKDHKTIAIIENEFGEENIDALALGNQGINVMPLSGGCVCCQVSGSLIGAMAEIEEEIDPDWLIIELSEMAVMKKVLDSLRELYRKDLEIRRVVVVDASRYEALLKIAKPRLLAQIEGAEAIYLTKTKGKSQEVGNDLPKFFTPEEILSYLNNTQAV